MSQPERSNTRFAGIALETVGWPLFWGGLATFGYYFALQRGWLGHPILSRYTAGHPVEYVEIGLFFVGLSAIVRRGWQAVVQLAIARTPQLDPPPISGQSPEDAEQLLKQLGSASSTVRHSAIVRRLEAALAHVRRQESADQLDEELKYLADMEAERTYEAYALVRIIIWATPMLGFLGTVIGITLALGDLSPEALVNSPKEAMEGLLSGLSVAFDTTALALTLSMLLMFAQFLANQLETQLLAVVQRLASEELGGRFHRLGTQRDPQIAAVQRMSQTVISGMETLVRRQSEVWKATLDHSHEQWQQLLENTGRSVQTAVGQALRESLQVHSANLLQLEQAAENRTTHQWQQWQESVARADRQTQSQQAELARQTEILLQVLKATGQIASLEHTLNQNLRALAGSKNFEDTVMSLSAAIHLLNSRLGKPVARDTQVQLEKLREERAA